MCSVPYTHMNDYTQIKDNEFDKLEINGSMIFFINYTQLPRSLIIT